MTAQDSADLPAPPDLRLVVFGTGDFSRSRPSSGSSTTDSGSSDSSPSPTAPRAASRNWSRAGSNGPRSIADCPCLQPEDVNNSSGVDAVAGLAADLFVTAAYGQILSAGLLRLPRIGGINLHGSILPAYRGAAPVARRH